MSLYFLDAPSRNQILWYWSCPLASTDIDTHTNITDDVPGQPLTRTDRFRRSETYWNHPIRKEEEGILLPAWAAGYSAISNSVPGLSIALVRRLWENVAGVLRKKNKKQKISQGQIDRRQPRLAVPFIGLLRCRRWPCFLAASSQLRNGMYSNMRNCTHTTTHRIKHTTTASLSLLCFFAHGTQCWYTTGSIRWLREPIGQALCGLPLPMALYADTRA